uniref:Uncharacterized protein n=1 Tax=Oryzias melastigma TaxID=30732 RepID=A0A3B3BT55_ORYME
MASTTKLISEEQFLCSICQEVFKEPVSTRCGHNFCKSCITEYWDSTCQIQCPLCRTKFYRRPKFFVNTEFRDMVEHFRHMKVIKGKAEGEIAKPGDVPCDVCTETKMKAHKTCVVCLASYCQTHLELHQNLKMRKKIHKLEQLLQTDDHLHFLLNYPSYYQTVSSEDCEGEGGNTTMPEVWIPPQDELMMIQQCNAVDLTLNAFGAHPSLMVSSDGKHLSLRNGRFVLSSFFGARIEHLPIAYSTNFFSSGRFYYEVQVNRSQNFFLGVAKESMKVNPPFIPSPEDGVWIFRHTFGRYHTNGRHPDLILRQAPNVIGVFVDYEKGEVSFYDVEALLYSMTGMSEITRPKLYPIFGVFDDGSDPSLTITPVNFTVEDASFVEGN